MGMFDMLNNNRTEEAMLYYLYMMADGEVAYSEEKIFDSLCNELKIDYDTKDSVIEKCKALVDGKLSVFSIIIREKLDEQVGKNWFERDESSSARIIWNLVNLGYADSDFSAEEKKIVDYLIDRWSVKSEVYREFIDTADTILTLTKQKDWIASTFSKGATRDKREKEVDTEIEYLLNDVKLTIKELTM